MARRVIGYEGGRPVYRDEGPARARAEGSGGMGGPIDTTFATGERVFRGSHGPRLPVGPGVSLVVPGKHDHLTQAERAYRAADADARAKGQFPSHRAAAAEDHEETAVADTVSTVNIAVTAPCERCVHAPVCAIRTSLDAIRGGGRPRHAHA